MKVTPIVTTFFLGLINESSTGAQLSQALYIVAVTAATMAILVAIFYFGFRVTGQMEAANDANIRKRLVGRIRGLQILIGLLWLALVSGILQMRGEPLLPNLIGLTVNLLWQAGLFYALRAQKAKLRQLDTNGTITVLGQNAIKTKGI